MKPGGGRKKGSRFELKTAKQIAEVLGINYGTEIRRTPGSGSLLCRADVWVHPNYRNKFPYFVEMKNRQSWSLESITKANWEPMKWFLEAEGKVAVDPDYSKEAPTILIFSKNNIQPFVLLKTLDFEIFCVIAAEYNITFKADFTHKGIPYTILLWNEFIESFRG